MFVSLRDSKFRLYLGKNPQTTQSPTICCFPKLGKYANAYLRLINFISSWCSFPHNQNFSDNLSCRDTAVVTPNTKTMFFNKFHFITALADISEDKILTSPVKSLGFFSPFNCDLYFILR